MIQKMEGLLKPYMSIGGKMITNANGDIDTELGGFDIAIDTLTQIRKDVVEQKFFEVAPADYVPVDVGFGAYNEEIVQNLTFQTGGDAFAGDVDMQNASSRLVQTDVAIAPMRMPINTWAAQTVWSIIEVAKASVAGNWDVISARLAGLKKTWDLMVQEVAFLGHPRVTEMTGLINDPEVNINNTLIPKPVSAMNAKEFQNFSSGLIAAYVDNSQYTQDKPDMLLVPTDEYFKLVRTLAEVTTAEGTMTTPISRLEYLRKSLAEATRSATFRVEPMAYCIADKNASRGINKNRFVLYKKDPQSMKMTIPIDFTSLPQDTSNSMNWVQPAYGQYSGVLIARKREVLYFDQV